MSALQLADTPLALRLAELAQGGDARTRSPYGLTLPAPDTLVHFGSCTANPITPALLARHEALQASDAWPDPQQQLRTLYGAAQCMLAASGTDAEYSCALAMGPAAYGCILMDPAEIGSGCARAAAGLPHATGGPVQSALPVRASLQIVHLRDAQGRALPQAQVDEQVFAIAGRLARMPLLLHHVACSKTGLAAPSEAACLDLQRHHGAGARVVVDASQGRYSMADMRRWLGYGWAVIITGSKFFGAPPFCGATLFPAGWPPASGFAAGPGLRARWRLALETMLQPAAPEPAWPQALGEAFRRKLRGLRFESEDGSGRFGILGFDAGLDGARTMRLHRRLIERGFFIGQPVAAGPQHLLRVATGAQTLQSSAAFDLERLARAITRELGDG